MKIETFNSNQIGGCIVKITNDNNKAIILDYGLDLNGNEPKEVPKLDNVIGIIVSHGHLDHIGMLDKVKDIPIYFNEGAYDVYKTYANHMNKEVGQNVKTIKDNLVIDIFNIKLIKTSHSSFNSNMILINVDNKNILYTGDFRLHGWEQSNELKDIKIDVLITEGTNINNNLEAKKEEYILKEFKKLQEEYKYIFVMTSSTNSERILSIGKSVKRGRYFIVDQFQNELIDFFKKWNNKYNFKKTYYNSRIKERFKKRGFTMLVRQGDFFKNIMDEYKNENYILVYSMWRGYLDSNSELKEFVNNYNNDFIHTSGHISRLDLERFVNDINPKNIMVVHTDNKELFKNIKINGNIVMDNKLEYRG